LDNLDKVLFQELSNNCRASFTELGEKYDVSVNTIKTRVETMIEQGIIVHFDVQLKLSLFNASFALIILRLKRLLSQEEKDEIGNNPFITSVSSGIQKDGMVVAIYRNNDELNQVVEHLRKNDYVDELDVFQALPPPSSHVTLPSSKGIESLKKIDWQILRQLRWNGRMPINELAQKLGRSSPTIRKRLEYMRKQGMLYETVLSNIGVIGHGFIINFALQLHELTNDRQLEIEEKIREIYEDNFWVSWKIVNRPIIFLTFQVDSVVEAQEIQSRLVSMFPEYQSISQAISGEWKYYKDFRDQILEERSQ